MALGSGIYPWHWGPRIMARHQALAIDSWLSQQWGTPLAGEYLLDILGDTAWPRINCTVVVRFARQEDQVMFAMVWP